ncbi:hypothetical protein BGZ91_004146 [Linnemannia elongata]|nr:hypothetical protein BGZ91_004146 [Linnemannia elongata]KAG0044002.1 hypothetical protein BGZ90_008915 [Linnemannia elongata]
MKISLFAVIAAVVAVVVASPVPTSPQSVDSPSLKPANVSAVVPEDLIAKRDVPGLVKRGNEGRTYISTRPYYTGGAWRGASVVASALMGSFKTQFLQNWDRKHVLQNGRWTWYYRTVMPNGVSLEAAAFINDGYEVSAEKVAQMVYSAVAITINHYYSAYYDILDGGDNGAQSWGIISVGEV